MKKILWMAGCALTIAPLVAQAQTTYRCTGTDGKKYYGSTIPMPCAGRPVEQMNAQGRVVRVIDPEGERKAREEKELAATKQQEQDAVSREEQRRSRALLATYTSDRDIDDARRRALADNEKAMVEVENKIEALKKRRAGYEKEMEFYKEAKDPKKGAPPTRLHNDIVNVNIDLRAQEDLLTAKKREVSSINARYDEDKKRYAAAVRGKH